MPSAGLLITETVSGKHPIIAHATVTNQNRSGRVTDSKTKRLSTSVNMELKGQ